MKTKNKFDGKTKTASEEVNEIFDLGDTIKREFSALVESLGAKKKYCGIAAILLWMSRPDDERERLVRNAFRAKRKEWNGDAREMEKMVAEAIAQSEEQGLTKTRGRLGGKPPEDDGPSGHRRTK